MKAEISSPKWIPAFFAAVMAMLSLLAAIAYIVDPFFQFRVRDNTYELCDYTAGGLAKNYDYDTLIIGTCMVRNFDMEMWREKLSGRPLHIGLGGIGPTEMTDLMKAAYRSQKANTFYIGIDLFQFQNEIKGHIPRYLSESGVLSKIRYLLSHEVWFHYLPLDLGIMVLDKLDIPFPNILDFNTNIDQYQNDRKDKYTFGKDVVLAEYYKNRGDEDETGTASESSFEQMKGNIDGFLSDIDFGAGEHFFIFPPYSSLHWCILQEQGGLDVRLKAKRYFIERLEESGATVYDFQSAACTMDLNNYRDSIHYRPEINDWMVECFANGDYVVTEENAGALEEQLIDNTNRFRAEHSELFE